MRTRPPVEPQEWLTTPEVAVLLGLDHQKDRGTSAVRRLILSGRLGRPGEVRDMSASTVPNYRVERRAVDRYIKEAAQRVEAIRGVWVPERPRRK